MKITVRNTFAEVRKYIAKIRRHENHEKAWENEVISPFWDELCRYAPFDLSQRKPKPICDTEYLEKACEALEKLDMESIQRTFEKIVSVLPNYDDDPLTVVLFPLDGSRSIVNEKQNGVIGSGTYGNLFIEVNPLIKGYETWIGYVFAHEYHHTVFGNYWLMMHGKELTHKFYESLITEGEADSFALSLFPHLKPIWLFDQSESELNDLWESKYRGIVEETDVDYNTYMFGNENEGIPWCAGYKTGYRLVQNYLRQSKKNIIGILETNPRLILDASIGKQ